MVWKLAERLGSWLDGLKAARMSWKLYNLAEQTAHGPNDLLKYTSNVVSQETPDRFQRKTDADIDPRWRWLGLTCETNK